MTCKETQELISAYLDRQLAPADLSEVRLHLEVCAACRAEERSVLELKEALRTVKMPVDARGSFSRDRSGDDVRRAGGKQVFIRPAGRRSL